MLKKFKHPLAGQPPTTEKADGAGQPVFTLRPCELTPFGVKAADGLAAAGGLGLGGYLIMRLLNGPNPALEHCVIALVAGYFAHMALGWILRPVFKVTTVIRMDAKKISISRWGWWHHYDRALDHRFSLLIHDKTNEEKISNDHATRQASMKGNAILLPVYYGNSYHVVLVYDGHRVDLLTVYGQKEAAAIVARLQYCDRRLNEATKMGSRTAPNQEKEWTPSPGGLNNE